MTDDELVELCATIGERDILRARVEALEKELAESRKEYEITCAAVKGHQRAHDIHNRRVEKLEEALKPWGSGGIITGTMLAWIAAKDPAIAKAIVYGKAAVDRAINP